MRNEKSPNYAAITQVCRALLASLTLRTEQAWVMVGHVGAGEFACVDTRHGLVQWPQVEREHPRVTSVDTSAYGAAAAFVHVVGAQRALRLAKMALRERALILLITRSRT